MAEDPTGVDRQAPVLGEAEIEIKAPPEAVWDVLAAIPRWPSWNPDVKSVAMQDAVEPGSEFRWKAGPGTIKSTLLRVEAPRLIAWKGRTMGIQALHFYWLEATDGGTSVRTAESYDGLPARLLRRPVQRTLDKALGDGLRYLRSEVERRVEASRVAAPRR